MNLRHAGLHETTSAFEVAASTLLARARALESLVDSTNRADVDPIAPEEVARLADRLNAHTQTLHAMGAEIQATLDRTFEESRFDRGYVDDQAKPPHSRKELRMTLTVTACPVCGGWFEMEHAALGLEVECPDCEEILAVVATEPVELAPAREPDLAPSYPADDRPV